MMFSCKQYFLYCKKKDAFSQVLHKNPFLRIYPVKGIFYFYYIFIAQSEFIFIAEHEISTL